MNFVLKPKCINDENPDEAQCLGHSARGFILPCCFMEQHRKNSKEREPLQEVFYQEKFNISNVKNIKEITQSKEWVEFYTILQKHPEQAPKVCWKTCSEDSVGDKYGT